MSDSDNPLSLREELEVRVVALLTGELPEADADELETILSVDAELSAFRDRMAILIGDVHAARDEIVPPVATQVMRLSDERRREIFGDVVETLSPPEEESKKWWHLKLWEIAAMFVISGILAAILIPSVGAVREQAVIQEDAYFEEPPPYEMEFALNTAIPSEQMQGTPQPIVISEALRASSKLEARKPQTHQKLKDASQPKRQSDSGFSKRSDVDYDEVAQSYELLGMVESEPLQVESESNWGAGADVGGELALSERVKGTVEDVEFASKDDSIRYFANDQSEIGRAGGGSSLGGARSGRSGPVDAFAAPAEPRGPVDPFAAPSGGSVSRRRGVDRDGADQLYAYDAQAQAEPSPYASSISITAGTPQEFVTWQEPDGAVNFYDPHAEYRLHYDPFSDSSSEPNVSAAPIYVPPTLEQRKRSIVIPQVNFSGMPLSQVIKTLSELSVEYDPERVGVRLEYSPVHGEDPRVNISLRNLNLDRILEFVTQQVNHEHVIIDNHVRIQSKAKSKAEHLATARLKTTAQRPKAEKTTVAAPISTFSLNVSDVSFKLAEAALSTQRIPSSELIRTEEFVNSFNYGDPAPREDEPVTLNWEIAQHPYQHNRQIVRFSLQTQAAGRAADQALNLNLLIDNSGSMQRPDRRAILEKSLESLQSNLTDDDQLNIILFARQPRLVANADSIPSQQAAIQDALNYQPEGGTNLEAGLQAAYENAQAHYNPAASNRVILMTDGAANLGDVDAGALAEKVVEQRKQGIALDAYGIGWEDYNDALLEGITRNGDGRYAFLNSVDSAADDFAEKLAGTLRVAAADVKVQIIWNPERVTTYRQIGYDLHQLKTQDFRDNTVDAAEIGEAESGTALYVLQINEDPDIIGGLGKLQVRYRVPATGEYIERAWPLEMPRQIVALEDAPASLRLAATSALFAERLAENPYAANYSFEDLEALSTDLPEAFPTQSRVVDLQNMIQSAQSLFTSF